MDADIKLSILDLLSDIRADLRRNLLDAYGRAPLAKVADAAVGALDAWKKAGQAVERHYSTLCKADVAPKSPGSQT